MNRLFEFLKNNFSIILFVFLEIFAFSLTIKNKTQTRNFALNTSGYIQSFIFSKIFKLQYYFALADENQKIIEQYRKILEDDLNIKNSFCPQKKVLDSIYAIQNAWIVQNSVLLQNNYFTVNVGKNQGITPEAGVISPQGVVGIITNVGKNYSVGLSVLNKMNGFSAKLKKSGYFGAMTWDGKDYRFMTLSEIPNHVKINVGDTIVTTGFDAIFPPNYPVGTVDTFYKNYQDNFYTIKVKLFEDLKKTSVVFVIINKNKKEITEIQSEIKKIVR